MLLNFAGACFHRNNLSVRDSRNGIKPALTIFQKSIHNKIIWASVYQLSRGQKKMDEGAEMVRLNHTR